VTGVVGEAFKEKWEGIGSIGSKIISEVTISGEDFFYIQQIFIG